jgi:hypothetical protein
MKTVTQVWYLVGDPDKVLWATKEDAEKWAREAFPEEDFAKRYARIRYYNVESYDTKLEGYGRIWTP